MKAQQALVVLFAFCIFGASALNIEEHLSQGFEQLEHKFGGVHLKKTTAEGTDNFVIWPEGGLFSKPEHLKELQEAQLYAAKHPEQYKLTDAKLLECDRGEFPGFFKFLPNRVATLTPANPTASYSSPCFGENTVTLTVVSSSSVSITHQASGGHLLCGDGMMYTTIHNFHVDAVYFAGTHTYTFTGLSAEEMTAISDTGVLIFRFCDKVVNELPDVFKTVWLFLGGLGLNPKIPFFGSRPDELQILDNIKFIKESTGYQWERRPQDVVVDIDPSLIQSGDFLAITRLDGLDQIIEFGAGSHAGHSTMLLWVEDELYVVESQAAWYWPRKGLQINPFSQWVEWARNADFMVTWLPLRPEIAAQFNETRAYEWFKSVEGMPYGYHNFLLGWIDTVNASYPALLDPDFVAPLFAIVEHISPFAADEVFLDAMNMRLGTSGLNMSQVAEAAFNQGYTMPELAAIPEQDGWWYEDGYSYVCSAFVTAMWKAGGLFDNYTINAVEFTPRDIYQMTYINSNPPIPDNCVNVDPGNPYCQIMGAWRMQFPGISTVPPYDHMNEHCPSQAPLFTRTPGC